MAAGDRTHSRARIALVALCVVLVGAGAFLAVTATSESDRAGRFERETAIVNTETRATRLRLSKLKAEVASAERLQIRLQADVGMLMTIDRPPTESLVSALESITALTKAENDLLDRNTTSSAVVHARLDPLLNVARIRVVAFEKDLTRFSADRTEIQNALDAAAKR